MDLNLMQFAVALAKHRHFGRAAIALGVSQSSLSRKIAALEAEAGIQIFERTRRDVLVSPAGADFLTLAEDIVRRSGVITDRLKTLRDGRGGRLRIVSGPFVYDISVLPAARDVIRSNAATRLELMEREWPSALEMLMANEVDFCIFDLAVLPPIPALRFESFGAVAPGVYFCRGGHPVLGKSEEEARAAVREYPFVMPKLSPLHAGMLEQIDAGLTIDGASGHLLPWITVSSFRSAREIVETTDAISIGHVSQLQSGIAEGRLAVLTLPWIEKPPSADMGVVYKRERTMSPTARRFIELARKHYLAAVAAYS